MLAALCLTFALAPTAAIDWFPLQPGNKWTYREEGRFLQNSFVDEVLEPVSIGEVKAFPVTTSQDGKVIETVYYQETPDVIFIVAYDPKKPLKDPRPLFKASSKKETWDYVGLTPFLRDFVPLKLKGESSPKGKRTVLGREAELLEVKFDAQLGATSNDVVLSKQVALYAKGIGLVEMTARTTVGRQTDEVKLKLVDFKPANP